MPDAAVTKREPVFVTVKLDVPLVRGETTIDTIRLRKPSPGDLRGLKLLDIVQADTNAMIQLLPRISDPFLIPQEIEQLDLSDFIELSNQVAGFLPQQGTSTGSPTG